MATISRLVRYPVKGLSPEPLPEAALRPGATLPADRRYAIENGPSGFDTAAPAHLPKTKFLMLMRHERLAALRTRYDDASETLTVALDGREVVRAALATAAGRAALEAFFARYCADDLQGPPRLLEAAGHSFSDSGRRVVSLINLASVAAVAREIGRPIDPLRFRGNLYLDGLAPWDEFAWVGREIALGTARARIVKRIVRCPATNVDPTTAARDMDIPLALKRAYGHADCGVYAEIIAAGRVAPNDAVRVIDA